jgi:hypothetical protein
VVVSGERPVTWLLVVDAGKGGKGVGCGWVTSRGWQYGSHER